MKTLLRRVASAAAIAAAGLSCDSPARAADRPPNIIVIMLDDVSDDIDFMRRTMSVARSGTRYVNSFVDFPLCGPSRATFLTGQEARNHGVLWDRDGGLEPVGLLPQALQQAGYRTGVFGKKPKPTRGTMAQLGFERSFVIDGGDGRYVDPIMLVDGRKQRFRGYTTDIVYRWAQRFSAGARPYFTWIASPGAHAPAIPSRRDAGSCTDERFDAGPAFNEMDVGDKPSFMRRVDVLSVAEQTRIQRSFHKRCDVLQADDRWIPGFVKLAGPDTCVFLTADNGFLLGQHRVTGKLLLYEESIRVPLIMWGCGAERGGIERRLVSNTDLPATILELAGATPGRPLDGRSLFARPRSTVRLTGRWGENETAGKGKGYSEGIRQAGWAFFRHSNGAMELYDLKKDPAEELNLANEKKFVDRRRRMKRLLEAD